MNLLYRAIFVVLAKDAEGNLWNLPLRSALIFSIIVSMLFFPAGNWNPRQLIRLFISDALPLQLVQPLTDCLMQL